MDVTKTTAPMELEDLLACKGGQLDEVYLSATTPALEELSGDYNGLLLEGHLPDIDVRFPIRLANQPWLPWKGKTFFAPSARGGRGENRFAAGRFRKGIWSFETALGDSEFGGEAACIVNYDIEGNSALMRRTVFDEMKSVKDGLYLGKGGIRFLNKNRFTFYWAIAKA